MRFIVFLFAIGFMLISCQKQVKKRIIQPTNGYAQMVVLEEGSKKTLYISGQIGEGEDLAAQMKDVLDKLEALLKSEGGDYSHLVKINTYIVDYEATDLDVFRGVRKETFGSDVTPASTLVGVTSLAVPEWLIEIDAIAVIL